MGVPVTLKKSDAVIFLLLIYPDVIVGVTTAVYTNEPYFSSIYTYLFWAVIHSN
jgi:hypothetical protein